MKKTLLVAGAMLLLMGIPAWSQDETNDSSTKDRLDKIEQLADKVKEKKVKKASKVVDFNVLSRFGYGYILPLDFDKFNINKANTREIWFNVCELTVNAAEFLAFDLGFNLKWDRYRAGGDNYVYLDSAHDFQFADIAAQKLLYPAAGGEFKTLRSQINTFSLEVPLAVNIHAENFALRLGGIAGYTASAWQKEKAEFAKTRVNTLNDGGNVNAFYYGPFAEVSYDGVGIYVKYIPVEIVPGAFKSLLTIGLTLGF